MYIEHNILKYYLRNVYFITGTAYAGKSTTVRMLADRYDMVFCGENYFSAVTDKAANTTKPTQTAAFLRLSAKTTARIPERRCVISSQSILVSHHPQGRMHYNSLGE